MAIIETLDTLHFSRDGHRLVIGGWVTSTRISLGRGESHDMQVHAEPTLNCYNATKVSTADQYIMFKQADQYTYSYIGLRLLKHVRPPCQVRSVVNVA